MLDFYIRFIRILNEQNVITFKYQRPKPTSEYSIPGSLPIYAFLCSKCDKVSRARNI